MSTFIRDPDNQACSSDADCVVVHVGCAEVDGAMCAQVGMSRTAAESSEWAELVEEANDSCGNECAKCGALLGVTCGDGLCFRL